MGYINQFLELESALTMWMIRSVDMNMVRENLRKKLCIRTATVEGLFKPFEESILTQILEKFDLRLFSRKSFTSYESVHNFLNAVNLI